MVLPPLIPDTTVQGVAQYPAKPVLVEYGQCGVMAGTRTENVTYVAQRGGAARLWPGTGRGRCRLAAFA